MKNYLYSIFDSVAETFLPFFTAPLDAVAIRTFRDCVNSTTHHFAKNPADYTLYLIGTWYEKEGRLDTTKRNSLGNGLDYVQDLSSATSVTVKNLRKAFEDGGGKKQ